MFARAVVRKYMTAPDHTSARSHSYQSAETCPQIRALQQRRDSLTSHNTDADPAHVPINCGTRAELEARLLNALEQRWTAAMADLTTTSWASAVARHHALPAGVDGHAMARAERYPSAS